MVVFGCFVLMGCDSTLNTTDSLEMVSKKAGKPELMALDATSYTAANDGLVPFNISGISATDFVTAGTGTGSRAEETISVEVPAGATVEAVYLYWARRGNDIDHAPWAASTIMVNGSEVMGNAAGNGPVDNPAPFEPLDTKAGITHKAEITSLGLITAGMNTIIVQDAPTAPAEPLGASLVVFYSEASQNSELLVFDGVDFLWLASGGETQAQRIALQRARPVTFMFAAAEAERSANLTLLIGDVEPQDAADRPNSLNIIVGDGPVQVIGPNPSPFQGFQGPEWDNYEQTISIPAGVEKLTIQPVSGPGSNPASLVWSFAGLSVPVLQEQGGQGCTPGYWRQPHHYDSWIGFTPDDILDDAFDVPSSLMLRKPEKGQAEKTQLKKAIKLRGGKVNALIRHAVAALLNASNPNVNYDLTPGEVVSKFNAAIDGGDIEATKNEFADFNELGCPLN